MVRATHTEALPTLLNRDLFGRRSVIPVCTQLEIVILGLVTSSVVQPRKIVSQPGIAAQTYGQRPHPTSDGLGRSVCEVLESKP